MTDAEIATLGLSAAQMGINWETNLQNLNYQTTANERNIQFARETAQQNRKWALEDWQTQSAYNHPKQQMQRLREAGLNPQLVYGKGADNTAAMVRSSDATPPQMAPLKSVPTDLGDVMGKYMALKQSQAQTDLLQEQRQLVVKEGLNKDANTANLLQSTASNKFQLEQAMRFKDLNYSKAIIENQKGLADLRRTISETRIGKNRDLRESAMNQSQIGLIESQTKNEGIKSEILSNESIMKEFESKMLSSGITVHDPWYYRTLATFVDAVGGDVSAQSIMTGLGLSTLVGLAIGKAKGKRKALDKKREEKEQVKNRKLASEHHKQKGMSSAEWNQWFRNKLSGNE